MIFRTISVLAWVGLLCLILFLWQLNRIHTDARCDVQAEQLAEIQMQTSPAPEKHYILIRAGENGWALEVIK